VRNIIAGSHTEHCWGCSKSHTEKSSYKLLYVFRKAVIIQQWKQTRGARHTKFADLGGHAVLQLVFGNTSSTCPHAG